MKKVCFVAVSAAAVLFCGCRHTHVEQVRAGEGRQDWYQDIRSNYPGFRPPRLVSPGISGQTGPAVKKNAANDFNNIDNVPVNEIEAMPVDPAADTKDTAAAAEKPAPAPEKEVKDEPKKEAKADSNAAVAEVKTDKAAPAAKAAKAIEPPDPTSSEIYVVQYGDTLGALSKKFYGSVRYVNLLQKANSDLITNANVLKPGMKLIIPKL